MVTIPLLFKMDCSNATEVLDEIQCNRARSCEVCERHAVKEDPLM